MTWITRLARLSGVAAGLALVLAALTTLLVGLPASATAADTSPVLALRASGAPAGSTGVDLVATLRDASTSVPLAGVIVRFAIHLPEFSGAPTLVVGIATTDAAGQATLNFQPLWAGPQSFVATATNSSGVTIALAATSMSAPRTDPFAGPVESLRPDGLIGRWTIVALLSLIVGLWIALVGVVVRVRRGPTPFAR